VWLRPLNGWPFLDFLQTLRLKRWKVGNPRRFLEFGWGKPLGGWFKFFPQFFTWGGRFWRERMLALYGSLFNRKKGKKHLL